MNLYAYVGNDPLNLIDLFGLFSGSAASNQYNPVNDGLEPFSFLTAVNVIQTIWNGGSPGEVALSAIPGGKVAKKVGSPISFTNPYSTIMPVILATHRLKKKLQKNQIDSKK